MEHQQKKDPDYTLNNRQMEKSTIRELVQNSKDHKLHAANKDTGIGTHHNELKNIQDKKSKEVEPNNPKAENPAPNPIDEKDLPPFQAGKPII